jgi:ribonuclease D
MLIINNQEILDEFCQEISNVDIISIDTEFSRRSSYYAKLSIIQVKAGSQSVIIDAMSNLNLSAFNQILINNKILKLFHAPREDFSIFYHLFGMLPCNIFDIQIAASLCGFGKQLSYNDICYKIYDITIDKAHQKSNWLKRPIDQAMIEYALQDVEYLEPIYRKLNKIITENNLRDKYNKQMKSLLYINNYAVNLEEAWQKVKVRLDVKIIPRLQILASYREEQAQLIDIPRKHFILDEDLVKLCKTLPITKSALVKLRLKSKYLHKQKYQDQMISLCKGIQKTPIDCMSFI